MATVWNRWNAIRKLFSAGLRFRNRQVPVWLARGEQIHPCSAGRFTNSYFSMSMNHTFYRMEWNGYANHLMFSTLALWRSFDNSPHLRRVFDAWNILRWYICKGADVVYVRSAPSFRRWEIKIPELKHICEQGINEVITRLLFTVHLNLLFTSSSQTGWWCERLADLQAFQIHSTFCQWILLIL